MILKKKIQILHGLFCTNLILFLELFIFCQICSSIEDRILSLLSFIFFFLSPMNINPNAENHSICFQQDSKQNMIVLCSKIERFCFGII